MRPWPPSKESSIQESAEAAIFDLDPLSPGPSDPGLADSPAFAELLARSYRDHVGVRLAPLEIDPAAMGHWLYEEAPFCLLVHNTAADPRFIYLNRAAQACFEWEWDEITRLPSRLSAESPNQAERQKLIDSVIRFGFATGYRGLRRAKSGRRFWIEDVTMWQVTDASGVLRGQAAIYHRWQNA